MLLRILGSSAVLAGLLLFPHAVSAETSVSPAVDVAMQRHDAGTFYIDGAIRGYGELRMLVDTGSSYVVIGEAVLAALEEAGEAEYSRDLAGFLADGTLRIIPIYRVGALRLGQSCWVNDIEAAVFPGVSRPILGINILTRLAPFTFSADPPTLGLHHCQAPLAEVAADELEGGLEMEMAGALPPDAASTQALAH
jgi:predicted aspartyl protease